jgi:hypothetical protein
MLFITLMARRGVVKRKDSAGGYPEKAKRIGE